MSLELPSIRPNPRIVPWFGRLASRLGEAVEADDRGSSQIGSIAGEQAEEPVILASSLDAHLVEPGHVAVHRLPLAAAGERGRRRFRNRVKHGVYLGGDLGGDLVGDLVGQPFEEVERRYDSSGSSDGWRWKKWTSHGSRGLDAATIPS
ncbi:MAG: hypothetical protein OXE75_06685 [bacterium]|nr:hypothetical protein [bacterium]